MRWITAALLLTGLGTVTPAPAFGQIYPEIGDRKSGVIEVTASATINYEPDRARISFAVITFAETAAGASRANAVKMNRIQDALDKSSGAEGQVQTTSFRLDPHYPPEPESRQQRPRPDGYTAYNMIEVALRDVRSVGDVIDAVIAAGADNVSGLSFSLEDMSPVRKEALENAYQNAETQAKTLAAAAGKSLGALLAVRTPPAPAVGPMVQAEGIMMRAATPIEPGTLSYSTSVQVVFEIR
jgi:uncharacterized protein YggE